MTLLQLSLNLRTLLGFIPLFPSFQLRYSFMLSSSLALTTAVLYFTDSQCLINYRMCKTQLLGLSPTQGHMNTSHPYSKNYTPKITPPCSFHLQYKILLLFFRALHVLGPENISNLLLGYTTISTFRSPDMHLLPPHHRKQGSSFPSCICSHPVTLALKLIVPFIVYFDNFFAIGSMFYIHICIFPFYLNFYPSFFTLLTFILNLNM